MTTTNCPTWCTTGTDGYPCDGSHNRIDFTAGRIASGSLFPVVDERGAVFPAVTAGASASPAEGRGPHIFLFVRGDGYGDGHELTFPLDEAFGLAVDILDNYARVIAEIDRPAAPWRDMPALEETVADIAETLSWRTRSDRSSPSRRRELTAAFDATDAELDLLMKRITDHVMAHDNSTLGVTSEPTPSNATHTSHP